MSESSNPEYILGYPFFGGSSSRLTSSLLHWLRHGDHPKSVVCGNPHSLAVADSNPAFQSALKEADWLVPDGVGILYASRIFNGQLSERITGFDIFHGLMSAMNEHGSFSCFFLGSSEATLAKISQRVQHDFPNVKIAGVYSPPFKPSFDERDLQAMVAAVNEAKPDVLWVGLTAPKQELLIHSTLGATSAQLIGAIGAVFDFYAGTTRRPGKLAQRVGLEWLVRLSREPRRLWRRTLLSGPQFLWLCLRARLSGQDAGR
ncbi:MAG: WecB/TagA/CpsF family glycosyltransferase [Pseudomonadota bacterium]